MNSKGVDNSPNLGFWAELTKPIYSLAPMADVTDAPFRRIVTKYGKPDVFWTEFVSCDGLCSRGRPKLLRDLKYSEQERPIVAQFFGTNPEHFYQSAQLAGELGFDGIDINMGCPVKVICKNGSGASLIKTPDLAGEIIRATIDGAGDLPVSVKTRIGYNSIITEEWVRYLLDTKPAAITLHLRTAKEMSKVDAHWDEINIAVQLAAGTGTLIFGNGDVPDLDTADRLVSETGIDGIMLGRAVFGNPWLFNRERKKEDISLNERFSVMVEHSRLYEELFGPEKSFLLMRKHLFAYATGFSGAKQLRGLLESVNSSKDVEQAIVSFQTDRSSHITRP
jgi:nifR3 family TIM-barrel protein